MRYGGLQRVSLEIPPGITSCSSNGAGKTTLLRCLSTYVEPDEGRVCFSDIDIHQAKPEYCFLLGYLPENFTPRAYDLQYVFALYGALKLFLMI